MTLVDRDAIRTRGWARTGPCPALAAWAEAASHVAQELAADDAQRAAWLRCGGTWFAGVNVFPNEADGSVPGKVPPLPEKLTEIARELVGGTDLAFDPAQISVCYPGYPQPWDGENEAAFRFRLNRDAAHLDGLTRDAERRRRIGEVHGFILGIPLTDTPEEAAPLVVWEGSHEVIRSALRTRLQGIPPTVWAEEDVTEIYTETRRRIFEDCPRRVVHARPGEAYFLHRLAIHGVSRWGEDGGDQPRSIAYFRPDPFPGGSPEWWLALP